MLSNSLKEFYASAAATYAAALPDNAAAVHYLTKRGLSEDNARFFQLGVVAHPFPGHERSAGRLVIPYLNASGGVDGMAFRCIEHEDCKPVHNDKYLWPSGVDRRLFNSRALDDDSPYIAICEGEMDTITAVQAGIPAVGVPGVKAWQRWWSRCFRGYDTVFVLADADDSGEGREMAEKVSSHVQSARVVMMPEGQDVNSFVLANGPDALRARLQL
ncbi:toprim domain-containing protein [Kitasatospora aureofaciens]|uniref:toprim domain-containing protein n=1 Tax=Kitasatospora aureofaciens TaxID=1894 RepID=UPI0034029EE9